MNAFSDLIANFYKDGTKELHWGKIVSSIVFVLILLGIGLCNRSNRLKLEAQRSNKDRYTIGVTGTLHHNVRSSQPNIQYYYTVLGRKYSSSEDVDAQFEIAVVADGGHYFVEFATEDPGNSKLLLGQPVPSSITYSPDSGWIAPVK